MIRSTNGSMNQSLIAYNATTKAFSMPGVIHSISPKPIGIRRFFGRLATVANDAAGTTYQILTSLEQRYDAIQIGIGTTLQVPGNSIARSIAYIASCPDAGYSDSQLNGLSWVFANWTEHSGNSVQAQIKSFALGNARPRLLLSAVTPMQDVPRTDGGKFPLVAIRLNSPAINKTLTVCGDGSSDFYANIDRVDGRTLKVRRMVGNGLSTFSGTDASQTPVLFIVYYAKGRVVNVLKFGDSNAESRNVPMGDGYLRKETIARSSMDGIAWECGNWAWSGLNSGNYHKIAMDTLGKIPCDIAFYQPISPNDIAAGSSESAARAVATSRRYQTEEFLRRCSDLGVIPILATCPPCTTAALNYTACDIVRREHNAETLRLRDRGVLVLDIDKHVAGSIVGGQTQPLAGATIDGIHLSSDAEETIRIKELIPALNSISIVL